MFLGPLQPRSKIHKLQVQRRHQARRSLRRHNHLVYQELRVTPLHGPFDILKDPDTIRVGPFVRHGVKEVHPSTHKWLRREEVVRGSGDPRIECLFRMRRYYLR